MRIPPTTASAHAWFNGVIEPREAGAPSIASISFHLGTGVFDGLMAYWNEDGYYLHRPEDHLRRFLRGAARMGLSLAWTVDDLIRAIHELLACEPEGTQYIRPIAYRKAPELWITGSEGKAVDVSIFTVRVGRDNNELLSCHVSPVERISSKAIPAHTKVSGAYVNSFNARKTAELAGFNDGIMLDREGCIAEASAANFFSIRDGRLFTPALTADVFPGVTRLVVLEIARDAGISVYEGEMRPADLVDIDGAFLCSTLMEIKGLGRLNDRSLNTAEEPVFRAVVEQFRKITQAGGGICLGRQS